MAYKAGLRQKEAKVFIGIKKKNQEKCTRMQTTTRWREAWSTSPGRERNKNGTLGARRFWFVQWRAAITEY